MSFVQQVATYWNFFLGIETLTKRHGILRSTFHPGSDVHPRPFVAEHDASLAAPILTIMTLPENPRAQAKVLRVLRSATDLSSGFAVRWVALTSPKVTELYAVAHHIALDGASMSQLSAELFDLLVAAKTNGSLSHTDVVSFSQSHNYEV